MGSCPDFAKNPHPYENAVKDPNPRWRELYESALLELERENLLQYIELAERAIREHANARTAAGYEDPQELQDMRDALQALSLLRRNALKE